MNMSHLTPVKTKLNNQETLVTALKELGYTVQVHDAPVQVRNSYSADYGVYYAEIIIPRETLGYSNGYGYDVGFAYQSDSSYQMITDGSAAPYNTYLGHNFLARVIGKYAEITVKQLAGMEKAHIILNERIGNVQTILIEDAPQALAQVYC